MADIRALLRTERASRRITHPHAAYTANGALSCVVCGVPVKSDSLWRSHLASTLHVARLRQPREGQAQTNETVSSERSNRKRKAADDEDDDVDTRKKAKPVDRRPRVSFVEPIASAPTSDSTKEEHENIALKLDGESVTEQPLTAAPIEDRPPPIDEEEWAAFERDVAIPAAEASSIPAAYTTAATISAAPVTAEELAARAREEASRQAKEAREAELEGEKEDATRQLEEEFDEMEELEARVKRLREKREALREKREALRQTLADTEGDPVQSAPAEAPAAPNGPNVGEEDGDEDSSTDDSEDDWDAWRNY